MTVLMLTGGTGMVGRNLRDLCARRGIALLAPTRAECDLLDARSVGAYLARHRPCTIIHAAGRVGGIQANMRAPVAFLTENWDMGRNLLLAAREAGIRRIINLGSSCMYPANSPHALTEDRILSGPLEPTNEGYALAKIAIQRLGAYLGQEEPGFACKTLIPSNLYGPHDNFDPARSHLVPAIIRKLVEARESGRSEVEIWGDGLARREFLYAGDLAEAILMAVERFDSLPDILNIGTGEDFSINEHYEIAAGIIGYGGGFRHDLSKPSGMRRKLLDVSRAARWGWTARTSLADGIALTYQHFLRTDHAHALSAR